MPTFEFTAPDGKTYAVDGPDGATKEQAFAILQQQLGGDSSPVTMGGVAKAAGVGALKGAVGLAGTPADLANLAARGYDYMSGSHVAGTIAPITDKYGSAALNKKLENYTGKLPEPTNRAEEIAQTVGEFAPLALMGPGGIARRVGANVLAPAAGSEIAKEATKGSDLQPYAQIAGAVIGGGIGSKIGRSLSETKQAIANAPGADIKAAAQGQYDALTSRNVAIPIKQADLDTIAGDITTSLNNKGIRPSVADGIHKAMNELRTPATVGAPDVADLVASRQTIKMLLASPDANKAGAAIALPKIDAAIERLSPGTMAELRAADKNWTAFKANEALDKRSARAELRAAGEHSGLNVGNKIKQNVTNYLVSNESRYLSPENRASLEKVVRGTHLQNLTRFGSNLLGGGGGLGSTLLGIGGASAGYGSGHPELAALPVVGLGLRMASNRMVAKQAAKASAEIRNRSPYGLSQKQINAALNKPDSPLGQMVLRILVSTQSQPNLSMPLIAPR